MCDGFVGQPGGWAGNVIKKASHTSDSKDRGMSCCCLQAVVAGLRLRGERGRCTGERALRFHAQSLPTIQVVAPPLGCLGVQRASQASPCCTQACVCGARACVCVRTCVCVCTMLALVPVLVPVHMPVHARVCACARAFVRSACVYVPARVCACVCVPHACVGVSA